MCADGGRISLAGAAGDAAELIVSFVVIVDAALVGVESVLEEERSGSRTGGSRTIAHCLEKKDCCSLPLNWVATALLLTRS
jgi:hypothetical protein